jgi:hypothetical protein
MSQTDPASRSPSTKASSFTSSAAVQLFGTLVGILILTSSLHSSSRKVKLHRFLMAVELDPGIAHTAVMTLDP